MAVITKTYTVIAHQAEEGGYWGEVLELPGCVSQGETLEELQQNIKEAIEAVLRAEGEGFAGALQVESTPAEYRVDTGDKSKVEGSLPRHVGGMSKTEERGVSWKSIMHSSATTPTTASS